ncbi:4'-phosphopantetheinyl transferase family protein [Paenibacillus sp. GCM10012307]|uniref:4'-phosphopantetheinyl transferase superfamily protein n=1 Tax=Paenibacillus roseus TaxID=2798579 RepID=A0A934J610_9BACL|nr:4'-phosphopantetheinyl transferase superfamily protein [Paenibacillus roseus]MBJ6362238.1 4'-phosphopantetheinyl transferase superfamily protein [Paenibacillus roseus]
MTISPAVYAVKVPGGIGPELLERGMSLISEERRRRIARFHFQADKYRSLLGELLIRHVLCTGYAFSNADIVFRTGTHGKPSLEGGGPRFNFSHAGDWVCAVFHTEETGIDIEQLRPIELDVAKRFFASEESAMLSRLEGEAWRREFYRLWTMKEAYVKMRGAGLNIPLHTFTFQEKSTGTGQYHILENGSVHPGSVHTLPWEGDYACAVCFAGDAAPDTPVIYQAESLLEYASIH